MDNSVVLIVCFAVSTAATSLAQIWRERQAAKRELRQRMWDKEDRIEIARSNSEAIALVGFEARGRQNMVIRKIAENTELSAKAFEVGNSMNEKLLALHEKIDRGLDSKLDRQ